MLILKAEHLEVIIKDDHTFSHGSADNVRTYETIHELGPDSFIASRHGVEVRDLNGTVSSCILTAGGGATGVHEHTAFVRGPSCFVAVGPYIVSLDIPSLNLNWAVEVDQATCFGVYISSKHNCLISHGELEIVRLSHNGKIIWKASGADIFTNGFTLLEDTIEVIDFNERNYIFDVVTGHIVAA